MSRESSNIFKSMPSCFPGSAFFSIIQNYPVCHCLTLQVTYTYIIFIMQNLSEKSTTLFLCPRFHFHLKKYTHTCIFIYIYVCIYHTHVFRHICIHLYIYTHMHVYMCLYVCAHTQFLFEPCTIASLYSVAYLCYDKGQWFICLMAWNR